MCIYVCEHACVCVMFCNTGVHVSPYYLCVHVCFNLVLRVHVFYYMVCIKNVIVGMYTPECLCSCACMTEHIELWICMRVWIYCWGQWYLVRCFPHYFSGKWAISHIAWSLIVFFCKSMQELQLKCSLTWYNWCLPNPLFAHLPLSLNF